MELPRDNTAYDKEPTFKSNLQIYGGRYCIIGDEHKKFAAEKMNDPDYHILTLAAIENELRLHGLTNARVTINGDICATARGYELLAQRTLGWMV